MHNMYGPWECAACGVRNWSGISKCRSCNAPRPREEHDDVDHGGEG